MSKSKNKDPKAQRGLFMPLGRLSQFNSTELEIMKRLLENERPEHIQKQIGISEQDYQKLVSTTQWQNQYQIQCRVRDWHIRKRLENLSQEALDVVRDMMRDAAMPSVRLKAALELLDRAGYVKVEKRITVTADAESVIKELNRLGTLPEKDITDETLDEFQEADIIEDIAQGVVEEQEDNRHKGRGYGYAKK